jgi:hypothetical protein
VDIFWIKLFANIFYEFRNFNGLRTLEEGIVFAYENLTGALAHEYQPAYSDRIFLFPLFHRHSNLSMHRSAFVKTFFNPVGEE